MKSNSQQTYSSSFHNSNSFGRVYNIPSLVSPSQIKTLSIIIPSMSCTFSLSIYMYHRWVQSTGIVRSDHASSQCHVGPPPCPPSTATTDCAQPGATSTGIEYCYTVVHNLSQTFNGFLTTLRPITSFHLPPLEVYCLSR